MRKDATEFRQRFLRWKNGEQVYDKGRVIPHYRTGLDGEDDTVPSDNTRVVNPRLLTAEKIVDLPTAFELARAKHEAEQIGPTPNISQQERDLGRKKYETQLWVLLKKALELATDEMMKGIIDPRYAALGFGLGQVARAAGSVINAGKNLYKGYKISRAIDKATDIKVPLIPWESPKIPRSIKKIPSENIIDDYIKEDKILGDYIDEGAEATVYTDPLDKRFVIKQKSGLVAPKTLEELRDNIIEDLLLNDLPGMEPLEYLGFTEVDNSYNTVKNGMLVRVPVKYFTPFYRQRKITPLIKTADPFHTLTDGRFYTNDGLRKALIELGYTPTTKPDIYEFGRYPEIGDFSVGNVGVDDIGRFRVIDPMIHTDALLNRRIDLGYFK